MYTLIWNIKYVMITGPRFQILGHDFPFQLDMVEPKAVSLLKEGDCNTTLFKILDLSDGTRQMVTG